MSAPDDTDAKAAAAAHAFLASTAARAEENAAAETDRAEQHLRVAAAWWSVAAVCRAAWPPKGER